MFFNNRADAQQVLALYACLDASQGASLLFGLAGFGGVKTLFLGFKNITALLHATTKTPIQTFKTFTFASFYIYHRVCFLFSFL